MVEFKKGKVQLDDMRSVLNYSFLESINSLLLLLFFIASKISAFG